MPKDATLTKVQKNEVFRRVSGASLRPEAFEWVTELMPEYEMGRKTDDYSVSTLRHRSTGYFFTFGQYRVRFSPGIKTKVELEDHNLEWNRKFQLLAVWLRVVKEEDEAPDLWAAIESERALSDAASTSTNNEPFTPQERSEIAKGLEEVKQYLVEAKQMEARQADLVNGQLAYLRTAADRMGRKDWLNVAFSVFSGMVLFLSLPPEQAGALGRLTTALFGWIWTKIAGVLPSAL
jgi:hypothetical protein